MNLLEVYYFSILPVWHIHWNILDFLAHVNYPCARQAEQAISPHSKIEVFTFSLGTDHIQTRVPAHELPKSPSIGSSETEILLNT